MKRIAQKVMTLSAAVAIAATAVIFPAPHAQAHAPLIAFPEIGIQFNADGNAGQCGGRTGEQWHLDENWTEAIRFDTDSRPGGCRLAFGIYDPEDDLAGASVTYTFQSSPGGNPAQCGNQGTHQMPIQRTRTFGPSIRIDTDNRPGGCKLTFALSSPFRMGISVDYSSDGNRGQCGNALPSPGFPSPVDNSRAVTIDIDTDDRFGGCQLQLRLDLL
ncbi:hypothetical protein OOK31_39175 [Streptomyces sp. NBC_00249]|uniref:hypothetical protein n=1 Tax=Streptomyces sp. NBC_00249 TaxID=2975690 RepID=UPI0022557CE6|nr:hypothetical protein [Streptomyces sp. NBC_00249]MCX5199829.1 hypothetical protein [Streptomyces sp. NBC_00249]